MSKLPSVLIPEVDLVKVRTKSEPNLVPDNPHKIGRNKISPQRIRDATTIELNLSVVMENVENEFT